MTRIFLRVAPTTAWCLALGGCVPANPSLNFLGSYFPSWMLCGLIGVVAAALLHAGLAVASIDEFIPAKLPTYIGIAASVALATWLVVFGN
jgi:hypothetical protein